MHHPPSTASASDKIVCKQFFEAPTRPSKLLLLTFAPLTVEAFSSSQSGNLQKVLILTESQSVCVRIRRLNLV